MSFSPPFLPLCFLSSCIQSILHPIIYFSIFSFLLPPSAYPSLFLLIPTFSHYLFLFLSKNNFVNVQSITFCMINWFSYFYWINISMYKYSRFGVNIYLEVLTPKGIFISRTTDSTSEISHLLKLNAFSDGIPSPCII